MMSYYLVKQSMAKMPSKVKSPYCRIAVIEMEDGAPPPYAISPRCKGVIRIVCTWGPVPAKGTTPRSAYQQALKLAHEMADRCNAGGLP